MPKNSKSRKPTMAEVKTAIDGILVHMTKMQNAILQLDSMIYGYLDYKGETLEYKDWLNKKIREHNNEREPEGSSVENNQSVD